MMAVIAINDIGVIKHELHEMHQRANRNEFVPKQIPLAVHGFSTNGASGRYVHPLVDTLEMNRRVTWTRQHNMDKVG